MDFLEFIYLFIYGFSGLKNNSPLFWKCTETCKIEQQSAIMSIFSSFFPSGEKCK
jgi:hypothetical protein